MSESPALSCAVCHKRFSRLDHLRRHLRAVHTLNRVFSCDACGKTFNRKDILFRHAARCREKRESGLVGPGVPKPVKSTRSACDHCSSQKRACDTTHPCSNCVRQDRNCFYSWREPKNSNLNSRTMLEDPLLVLEMTSPTMDIAELDPSQILPAALHTSIEWYAEESLLEDRGNINPQSLEFNRESRSELGTINTMSFPDTDIHQLSPALIASVPWTISDQVHHSALIRDPTDSFHFLVRFTSGRAVSLIESFSIDRQVGQEAQSRDDGQTNNAVISSSLWLDDMSSTVPKSPTPDFGTDIWFTDDALGATRGLNYPEHEKMRPNSHHYTNWIDSSITWDEIFDMQSSAGMTAIGNGEPEPEMPADINRLLSLKCHDIRSGIENTVMRKSQNSIIAIGDWSPFLGDICADFFGPVNMHRFLELYWSMWYPNWPTIHKPTFNISSTSPALLACMIMTGACLSPCPQDQERAKLWFDIVEEMVFSDEATYNLTAASSKPCAFDGIEARVQAVQASYLVCIMQNWVGQETARGRIRRQRFSMIVSAARHLTRHANHPEITLLAGTTFRWKDFVLREELIRTLLYVFLLDTAFTIFNNLPPRMALRELTLDLACPEPCFQAESEMACFELITACTTHPAWQTRMPLYFVIRAFCDKDMEFTTQQYLAQSSVLNLWIIVSSFHILLYHIDPAFGASSQCASLRYALTNWSIVWNLRCGGGPTDVYGLLNSAETRDPCSWKRMGFMSNAAEYWLLARLFLDRLESAQQNFGAVDLFQRPARWHLDNSVTPMQKFDETSMDNLNRFISSFQNLRMVG